MADLPEPRFLDDRLAHWARTKPDAEAVDYLERSCPWKQLNARVRRLTGALKERGVGRNDVVAFLEFDSELLAPRYRAAEQALALLVLAGRLAPTVLVQTFIPDHEVLQAVRSGDPGRLVADAQARRRLLRFPPYAAVGLLSGSGSAELAAALPAEVDVAALDDATILVRADDWMQLGAALNAAPRPTGARARVAIDPPRL